MATVESGGSEVRVGVTRSSVPCVFSDDVVGAHPRLRFDVEQRVDLLRVGEVDVAAADDVGVALEVDAPAVDLGAAEQHRRVVGPLQGEVGARLQGGEVVVDAQRARRPHLDVEADAAAHPRIGGGGGQRRGGEELRGHVVAARPDRLAHVHGAGQPLALLVAEQAQLGVDVLFSPSG